AIPESLRVPVADRTQQQSGGVDGAGGYDDDVGLEGLRHLAAPDDDACDLAARLVRLEPLDEAVRHEPDVGVGQRRAYAHDMGVGLGLHEAGKPVAGRAADAMAVLGLLLVEPDADRQWKRFVPDSCQILDELPHSWLMADWRERIGL